MDKYLPDADKTDSGYVAGHSLAAMAAQVLTQLRRRVDPRERHEAGGEPARRHGADAVAGDQGQHQPGPISPPLKQVQMGRFDGAQWRLFGP